MTLPDLDREHAEELLIALGMLERDLRETVASCRMRIAGVPDTRPEVLAHWEDRYRRVSVMRDDLDARCRQEFPEMFKAVF